MPQLTRGPPPPSEAAECTSIPPPPLLASTNPRFMGLKQTHIHTLPPSAWRRAVHGLHTPRFTLDEGVLKLGAALHTALATEYLAQFPAKQAEGSGVAAGAAREEL